MINPRTVSAATLALLIGLGVTARAEDPLAPHTRTHHSHKSTHRHSHASASSSAHRKSHARHRGHTTAAAHAKPQAAPAQ